MFPIEFEVRAEKPINTSWWGDTRTTGKFPTTIWFAVSPPERLGRLYTVKRALAGEDLSRAIRLYYQGPTTVGVSLQWMGTHWLTWRIEIVDMALKGFATQSRRARSAKG